MAVVNRISIIWEISVNSRDFYLGYLSSVNFDVVDFNPGEVGLTPLILQFVYGLKKELPRNEVYRITFGVS